VTGLAGGVVALAVLLLAAGFGLWRRRNDGVLSAATGDRTPTGTAGGNRADEPAAPHRALFAHLGALPDTGLCLVQFSSALCVTCRPTRLLCAELAADLPGVRHVEIDAEAHLDAVRALDVWRTPTLLIVDAVGRILHRGAGLPTQAHLRGVVTDALAATR
jgi:hypothetical protein